MIVPDAENRGKNEVRRESSSPVQTGAILCSLKSKASQYVLSFLILFITIFFKSYGLTEEDKIFDKKIVEIEYGYPDQSIFVATVNSKGQPDSPMTLLAEELMNQVNLPWHAVPYPAKRLFENLKNGTTNFSILVKAPQLLESCIFSRKPVYSTTLNIYYIGDKLPVNSKEELIGKRIITIRGYSYAGLLKFISDPANNIANEVTNTHKAAFAMLKNSRADYLLDYASAAEDILSESPISGIKSNQLDQLDIFLVISKSYPDVENLMGKLEKIVETLDVNEILKRENEKISE